MTNINEISSNEQYNPTDPASTNHPGEFGDGDTPEDEDEFDDTDLDSNDLEDNIDLWGDDLEDDTDLEQDDDISTDTDFTGGLEDEDTGGNAIFFK